MINLLAIALVLPLFLVGELARWGTGRALGLSTERRFFVRFTGGKKWARVAAILAGSVAIYLAIVAGAFVLFRVHGVVGDRTAVASTKPGMPADGKLVPGDVIVAVDHEAFASLAGAVNAKAGAPVVLTIERDGTTREVSLQPIRGGDRWLLGIVPTRERRHDVALASSLAYPIRVVGQLVTQLAPHESADPGGPVRIYDEVHFDIPAWVIVLTALLTFGTYLLVASILVDLVRALRV